MKGKSQRLIIPKPLLMVLIKSSATIQKLRDRANNREKFEAKLLAAIDAITGGTESESAAALKHKVCRQCVSPLTSKIYKDWQRRRVAILAWHEEETDDLDFIKRELMAIAAGVNTTEGWFNPLGNIYQAIDLGITLGFSISSRSASGRSFIEVGSLYENEMILSSSAKSEVQDAHLESICDVACIIGSRIVAKYKRGEQCK